MSSLIDSVGGIFGGSGGALIGGIDPTIGILGGLSDPDSPFSMIADPLDLFGTRAGAAQDEIEGILTGSAQENIALQEGQLAEIAELFQPFISGATDIALPQLSSLALGGDVDYQPSKLFERQLDQGRTGVLRGQAAGGAGVKSSRTFERLSDLVSGLAGEDIGRFEQGQQALLAPGVTATNQLGQAGTQLTGNIGSIFSNLGQGLNQSQQNLGQARGSSFQGLSSGLAGLSQFLGSRG